MKNKLKIELNFCISTNLTRLTNLFASSNLISVKWSKSDYMLTSFTKLVRSNTFLYRTRLKLLVIIVNSFTANFINIWFPINCDIFSIVLILVGILVENKLVDVNPVENKGLFGDIPMMVEYSCIKIFQYERFWIRSPLVYACEFGEG